MTLVAVVAFLLLAFMVVGGLGAGRALMPVLLVVVPAVLALRLVQREF